ncbi:MAG: hypothetical protein F6K18_14940 [Okeania sp. SIO2C2]|uniref:hypothetical protein n=1 Tax=Okeania sp. SIO2C2 TaxID=2607787 RepID=UPI0013B7B0E1|nr:hypothetical protein [Okeania sp. SIO2C2]NEP88013.1 hypothetical protein [Okeania sp. SIO2C2]
MSIVKIKLLETEASGFHVTLTANDGKFDSIDGFLPALPPELESSLSNWQLAYHQLEKVRKISTRISPKKTISFSSSEQRKLVITQINKING